jgi:hypothetical protein
MKPQAAVQPATDATVLEESYHRTPTALGRLLEDLLMAVTALVVGGEVGGVDPWVDPAISSRDLFFPAPVFMLFDGEDFIFQMHRVFTRIRSGASLEASSGSARGSVA